MKFQFSHKTETAKKNTHTNKGRNEEKDREKGRKREKERERKRAKIVQRQLLENWIFTYNCPFERAIFD